MTNLEHYFENLLYHGEDVKGEANKNALTEEQQKSVEQCAQYVIYSLFGTREHFNEWINREPASPWHRVEDGLPPKATWVLTVATDGNVKIFNIATVDAGGQWWTYSPQKILRELYGVRYWMPIEPPKEDADGK